MNNSDLYSVVRTLGEAVTIEQKIGNVALTRRAKMGAITATRRTFNLVDRAYLLTGSLALDIATDTDSFVVEGAYIVRDIDPDNKYLILAKIVEPTFSKHLMDIYCTKSTDVVSLKRKSVSDDAEDEEPETPPEDIEFSGWGAEVDGENDGVCWGKEETYDDFATNVYACFNIAPKTSRITIDGKFDQSLCTMIIPARYGLSKGDRVVKKGFVGGVLTDITYEVEGIETSLIETNPAGDVYGIAQYALRLVQ